ncbi:hypothetical protein [Rhizobium sp. No.120]
MKFAHGDGNAAEPKSGEEKVAIWHQSLLREKLSRYRHSAREYIRFAMKRADDQKPSSRRLAKISDS